MRHAAFNYALFAINFLSLVFAARYAISIYDRCYVELFASRRIAATFQKCSRPIAEEKMKDYAARARVEITSRILIFTVIAPLISHSFLAVSVLILLVLFSVDRRISNYAE